MTALAAAEMLPISPELILVSPPEVASLAREQLPTLLRRPVPAASPAERNVAPGRLELAGVYLFCLFVTVGPLVSMLLLTRGAPQPA
ncbi:MAG: hypothetical protein AABM30_04045 [Actinomycetota bacterium]